MWIHLAIHKILVDKAFTATDGLISQLFVVAFVHSTYVWIALIWGFPVQLSLWKSVYWLWRYKLNEVCDSSFYTLWLIENWKIYKLIPSYQVNYLRSLVEKKEYDLLSTSGKCISKYWNIVKRTLWTYCFFLSYYYLIQ